jgi:hypothetical protein
MITQLADTIAGCELKNIRNTELQVDNSPINESDLAPA